MIGGARRARSNPRSSIREQQDERCSCRRQRSDPAAFARASRRGLLRCSVCGNTLRDIRALEEVRLVVRDGVEVAGELSRNGGALS